METKLKRFDDSNLQEKKSRQTTEMEWDISWGGGS